MSSKQIASNSQPKSAPSGSTHAMSQPHPIEFPSIQPIGRSQKYSSFTKGGNTTSRSNRYEVLSQEESTPFSKILVFSNIVPIPVSIPPIDPSIKYFREDPEMVSSPINEDIIDLLKEIDNILEKLHFSTGMLTRKKTHQ
jgi:hypothetical protein